MGEPGKDDPKLGLIIPKDGEVGSTAWSKFPSEIFPTATDLARQIVSDPQYAKAYELLKRVNRVENHLKVIRNQTLWFQNILPKEEDPDIEDRWDDESIKSSTEKLGSDSGADEAEVTKLHEERKVKSLFPEFAAAYDDLESRVTEIVRTSIAGFGGEHDDVRSLMVFNYDAEELIDYNLEVLRGQNKTARFAF